MASRSGPAESCSAILAWSAPSAPQKRAVPVRTSTTSPGARLTPSHASVSCRSWAEITRMSRQGIDFLEAGHVDKHAAGDDRRDRRRVALRGPQSPPQSASLKPLYQWKSRPAVM